MEHNPQLLCFSCKSAGMYIKRTIEKELANKFFGGRVIIVIGPRQVGKTTTIFRLLEATGEAVLFLNGDDPMDRKLLTDINTSKLKELVLGYKYVFVDEVQRIPGFGLTAKIISDRIKNIQLILSGSSAFEIGELMQEPLTGRKWMYKLMPISWEEYQGHLGYLEAEKMLETRLVFGMYPAVIANPMEKQQILNELTESYLFKDVLVFGSIRRPELINKLVRALAWQIGSQVSNRELAEITESDPKTVNRYLDILEKAGVIFRLPSFSRNHRNELKKSQKVFFTDNGIRNAVIGELEDISIRNDKGQLWENFLLSERYKQILYHKKGAKMYFWRTRQKQEIDYIEERGKVLKAYEFKWKAKKSVKFPSTFSHAYKAEEKVIHRENFREFVIPDEK